ncbi:S-adenosyl-L-methionine-dependent methyltransferases superfamily protein [Perilla frutescens var. hirtella]|nr:S-adenosyl-L-methionine-dependent methyltransferases superfamily protein [Perilla frutescens var. hirtella]KAH6805782.1 S-adenosyl-L-methionine-dependent methyltransferases superfamily protein [Perilla frutescens var. frutescens]
MAINRRPIDDEGDWLYSSEWWDGDSSSRRTVFREVSRHGNGVVSVLAHPCSKPDRFDWGRTEKWLEQRCDRIIPGSKNGGKFKVSGYEWRTLHFNDFTRESTVKVLVAQREEEAASLCVMQQPRCLAVPYVKSMVSAGLATIASSNYELMKNAILGKQNLNVLCIGHGGGSIPLFLASEIKGALVHTVEIDPAVVSASIRAMGFPAFTVMSPSGKRARAKPDPLDEVLWKGTHERMLLFNSDAEKFILESTNVYDIIFIDAYDGEDIFPHKLWEPNSPFLQALGSRLHPDHGTVVVNLHADVELDFDAPNLPQVSFLTMGKHVSQVCDAYRDMLLENHSRGNGFAYTVSVPWVYNTTLVVCRGLGRPKESTEWNVILNTLMCKALEVEKLVNIPFSCLQYVKMGFTPLRE